MGKEAVKNALVRAGRIRGLEIINSLELCRTHKPLTEWSLIFSHAISQDSYCRWWVQKVEYDRHCYRVHIGKRSNLNNEEQDQKSLFNFTQGVIQGALEALTGQKFSGVKTVNVGRGDDAKFVEFEIQQNC